MRRNARLRRNRGAPALAPDLPLIRPQPSVAADSRMRAEMERIDVNGREVEIHSAGSGPVLLFLHGEDYFAQHRPWLDHLSRHFRVVAPRHPGFGQTPLPDGFRTIDDLTYHTLDLIAALG